MIALRWILFVPAMLLAYTVTHFVGILAAGVLLTFAGSAGGLSEESRAASLGLLAIPGIASAACAVVAVAVAPRHERIVIFVPLVFVVLWCFLVAALSFGDGRIFDDVAGLAASVVGWIAIYSQVRKGDWRTA